MGRERERECQTSEVRGRQQWGEPRDVRAIQRDFQAAREFTNRALSQVPCGAQDPSILPHIIAAMAGDRLVTFGRDDGQETASVHLLHLMSSAVEEERQDWDLKLSSPPSWCDAPSVDVLLADESTKQRFGNEARTRIAASVGVDTGKVHITEITKGSVHVKYTVLDLTPREKEAILSSDVTGNFRRSFDTFVHLKMSPAVLALHFNLNDLDERGNKNSQEFNSSYEVGPPGRTRTYSQPSGWSRYGLKVLGKYEEDTWLHPFRHDGNWYRAFHGTARSQEPTTAPKKIVADGFRASSGGKLGAGVYVSPSISYVGENYCPTLQLETTSGKKTFKFMLQVAVCPSSLKKEGFPDGSGTNQEWTSEPGGVRPYGLLIKES